MSMYPTYAFDESGKVAAFHGNKVIASGTDFAKVSETAEEYFGTLRHEKTARVEEDTRRTATHITTPNGDQGTILGRTASVFGDAITVRFENGQIRHYDTFVGDGLKFSKEAAADMPKSPVEYFQRRLDDMYVPSRQGLTARLNELDEVRRGAAHLAGQGVSYADAQSLHQIVVTADAERNEVSEALDHLITADAEAMGPPKMAYQAVEQASMGHSSGDNWLEIVAQEMIAESEAQDFDKLINEGPTKFASDLDDAALGNQGIVREMAYEYVVTRTAGFQGEAVDEYRERFVASTEMARRAELSYRKDTAQKVAKTAAHEIKDAPDEALFL